VARDGWEHVFKLYLQRGLRADVLQAQERAAANMTDETFGVFRALKKEEQSTDT
jgi:hypothetical protein